jgi:hypothetical protein
MDQHRIPAAPYFATVAQPRRDRRDPDANLPPTGRLSVASLSRRRRARVANMARRVAKQAHRW